MSVKEVKFDRKDELLNVRLTHNDGTKTLLNCEYFGKMEGFDGFVAFWGEGKEVPFLILATGCILSIEILEYEEKNDNSKGD